MLSVLAFHCSCYGNQTKHEKLLVWPWFNECVGKMYENLYRTSVTACVWDMDFCGDKLEKSTREKAGKGSNGKIICD